MNGNQFPPLIPMHIAMRISDEFVRDSSLLGRIAPPRKGHHEPLSPDFIAARTAFAEKWRDLTEEGIAAGYLDNDSCYECAGELVITDHTTYWVADDDD